MKSNSQKWLDLCFTLKEPSNWLDPSMKSCLLPSHRYSKLLKNPTFVNSFWSQVCTRNFESCGINFNIFCWNLAFLITLIWPKCFKSLRNSVGPKEENRERIPGRKHQKIRVAYGNEYERERRDRIYPGRNRVFKWFLECLHLGLLQLRHSPRTSEACGKQRWRVSLF